MHTTICLKSILNIKNLILKVNIAEDSIIKVINKINKTFKNGKIFKSNSKKFLNRSSSHLRDKEIKIINKCLKKEIRFTHM